MRSSVMIVLVAAVLSACGDVATEPQLNPDAPALSRAAGYRLVLVHSTIPDQPADAGAPVVNNLADAVAAVAAGGTIRVTPGTYATEQVVIAKPVTIEGSGDGAAVIRNEDTFSALWVQAGGSLSLEGLEFENAHTGGSTSVYVTGAGAVVDVDDVAFRVGDAGLAGLYFSSRTTGSALTIENSSFTGGFYGAVASVKTFGLRGSSFDGQRGVAMLFNGHGTVENNTMTDCGDFACIQAVGGATGTIAGNRLSNALTGTGPVDEGTTGFPEYAFFHHVILVFSGSNVAITGNEIDGCGWGQCITVGVGGHALIEDNAITAYQAQGTRIAIVAGDGRGGEAPAGNGSSAVVRNNQIVGVSDNTDREDLNDYGFRVAGLLAEGIGSSLVAEGNTVGNAYRGVVARAGARVTGSGNVAELLRIGAAVYDTDATMDVRGNDFADYIEALHQIDNTSSDLTCNYWGPNGPTGVHIVSGQGPSLYTPWATAPIAATGQTTGCTGGEGLEIL